MKSKEKRAKKNQAKATSQQASVAVRTDSRRGLLIMAALALLVAAGTWALFEFVIWSKVPSELVGKWVVQEGPDQGGTVDFYRNGAMVANVNLKGKLGIIEANVRVEGKRIYVTTRHQKTGEEGTRVQTIKTLDADRLVIEDELGVSIKLARAK